MSRLTKIIFETKMYIWLTVIGVIILCLFSLVKAQNIAEHKLFLSTMEMSPGRIFALKIMPTGEIVDLYQQYTTTRWIADLRITPNQKFLFVAADTVVERFRIEPNGDLLSLGTTLFSDKPGNIGITPNNEFVAVAPYGMYPIIYLFRLISTGELIDTNTKTTAGTWINPRGNPIITPDGEHSLQVFHLDYSEVTISRTQVIIDAGTSHKMVFTPDGSLGLLIGYLGGPVDLRVYKIDTTETISTTGQEFNIGGSAWDIAITPNARFAYVVLDTTIAILSINTTTGTITDTGKRFQPPITDFLPGYLRITADGKLVVIDYFGPSSGPTSEDWITTAFIGADGDLTWTGNYFPFGETYVGGADAVTNMELLPIYVTDVDSAQWQLYE